MPSLLKERETAQEQSSPFALYLMERRRILMDELASVERLLGKTPTIQCLKDRLGSLERQLGIKPGT